MPKPPRHEFLCPVCTSIGLKHRGIPQTLDFTAKNNPGESLHRGLSSRATPAAQGYKDSNLEMTDWNDGVRVRCFWGFGAREIKGFRIGVREIDLWIDLSLIHSIPAAFP